MTTSLPTKTWLTLWAARYISMRLQMEQVFFRDARISWKRETGFWVVYPVKWKYNYGSMMTLQRLMRWSHREMEACDCRLDHHRPWTSDELQAAAAARRCDRSVRRHQKLAVDDCGCKNLRQHWVGCWLSMCHMVLHRWQNLAGIHTPGLQKDSDLSLVPASAGAFCITSHQQMCIPPLSYMAEC